MNGSGERDGLPLALPDIGPREEELVLEVLRSRRLSLGPMLERFEREFAEWVGAEDAIAVSNGTAALHLGVRALGWGPGDRVATTPLSFVASANCLLYEGAEPWFCDIDDGSLNISPAAVEDALGSGAAGVLPVDLFGTPVAPSVFEAADRAGLPILEDACEALGAVDQQGAVVGSRTHPTTFAFYANKQMTTGEGGMVTCADPSVAAKIRSERNQGRGQDMGWLEHLGIGFNYRLSDVACALGVAQLAKLDRLNTRRTEVAEMYRERLLEMPGLELLPEYETPARRSWFVYVIRLTDQHLGSGPISERAGFRDEIITRLSEQGIPAKAYMPCLHLLPQFRELGYAEGQFPVAERVASETVALPFFPGMKESEVERTSIALAASLGLSRTRSE